MKYLILLLPILLACSHEKSINREVASSQPARIVKVLEPTQSSYARDKSPTIAIEIQAFKFGSAVAKGREIEISILEGKGKVDKSSGETDDNGYFKTFLTPSNIGIFKIQISVDRVRKIQEFEVTRPSVFQGKYSLEKSEFKVNDSLAYADGETELQFSLQMRNDSGSNIDAYGLKVQLHDGAKNIPMVEKGQGLYELDYKVGVQSGTQSFYVSVNDVKLAQFQNVKLKPYISFNKNNIGIKTLPDGRIKVIFPLVDKAGIALPNLNDLSVRAISNNDSGKSTPIEKEGYSFSYTFAPPKGKGQVELGVEIEGTKYFYATAISYDYHPVEIEKVDINIENKEIPPTGIDHLRMNISLLNKEGQKVAAPKHEETIRFETEGCIKLYGTEQDKDLVFKVRIVPESDCKKGKVFVYNKNKLEFERSFKFDYLPKQEKIEDRVVFSGGAYFKEWDYQIDDNSGWKDKSGVSDEFYLENKGVNEIIPRGCAQDADGSDCQSSRKFAFEYQFQARQNIVLRVTDEPSDWTSHLMESYFYFFPRKFLPQIRLTEDESKIEVTLPTGENVYFDRESKKIIGGVLNESAIDLGPSRHSRKFANVRYTGSGVVLRINGRGQDPRLGQFNPAQISGDLGNKGGKDVLIYKYDQSTGKYQTCIRKKAEFWPQKDINPIPFNFPTDEAFDAYLKKNCGFGL